MKVRLKILQKLYPADATNIRKTYNVVLNSVSLYSFLKSNYLLKSYTKKAMRDIFVNDNFSLRQEQLIKEVRQAGFWGFGDFIAKKIAKIKNPNKFLKIYKNVFEFILECLDKRENLIRKRNSLTFYKISSRITRERLDSCLGGMACAFYRFLTPITKNPQVKELENAIKKMGVKEVRLGDNLDDAKNVYQAVKIAFENHDKLPTRIFTPIILGSKSTDAFFEEYARGNSVIVYSPNKRRKVIENINNENLKNLEKSSGFARLSEEMKNIARILLFNKNFSTDVPYGHMLHEIGHHNQKVYLPRMNLADLSLKDSETIQKLTDYCYHNDVLTEAFAELYAKMRAYGVESLTKDELNLWKRMNSGYFTSYEKKLIRAARKENTYS